MRRIKTRKIKRRTQKIYDKEQEEISNDFENNKKVINSKFLITSKKLRNIVSGYCTRLKKNEM